MAEDPIRGSKFPDEVALPCLLEILRGIFLQRVGLENEGRWPIQVAVPGRHASASRV